jgi:hypothetical protein
MRAWLERYAQRRASLARSAEVERQAREIAIAQALERQAAVRQSYENINMGQTEGALFAREQLRGLRLRGEVLGAMRRTERDARLTAEMYSPPYREFWDPPWYVRIRAAAASLPGDLPSTDPRNYIRGDIPGEVFTFEQAIAATGVPMTPNGAGGAASAAGAAATAAAATSAPAGDAISSGGEGAGGAP